MDLHVIFRISEFFDTNLRGGATTDSFFRLKHLLFLRLRLRVSDLICIVAHTSPLKEKGDQYYDGIGPLFVIAGNQFNKR